MVVVGSKEQDHSHQTFDQLASLLSHPPDEAVSGKLLNGLTIDHPLCCILASQSVPFHSNFNGFHLTPSWPSAMQSSR